MQPYRNVTGDSGITAFESGPDFIRVEFRDGKIYLYTYASTGTEHVEQMKRLAVAGKGLCTFINQHVHDRYARRER